MNCKNCGTPIQENAKFCPCCGTSTVPPVAPAPVQEKPQAQPIKNSIPEKYEPLGAWSYVGLRMLFALPIIGTIFLFIYTFSDSNLNRKAFARSYWCEYLLATIVILLTIILYAILVLILGVDVIGL